VMRTLHENKIRTERRWSSWTGPTKRARASPRLVGSACGPAPLNWTGLRPRTSRQALRGELVRIGYKAGFLPKIPPCTAYYEFHIEQGPMLEAAKRSSSGRPRAFSACIGQHLSHREPISGPTREGRHDALVAAAEIFSRSESCRIGWAGNVATVAKSRTTPLPQLYPDRVTYVDIPSWTTIWPEIMACCPGLRDIAGRHGCPIKIEETWRRQHRRSTKAGPARAGCGRRLGYIQTCSGQGAGPTQLRQPGLPTAMIFVRASAGRSHRGSENTRWRTRGAATCCLHCLLRLRWRNDVHETPRSKTREFLLAILILF